ncbi:MAG: FIST C-terminal domain-containing protein [Nitrospirota bacterium]|nr:MAG: FIST C-terminal domain-containing protein [Nitrospirota bacterium]
MECFVATSKETNAELASQAVVQSLKSKFGNEQIDLVFLFFSNNFADEARFLVTRIHEELSPRLLVGCMAEGVIGEDQEIEGSPAVIAWAAQLPGVALVPIRLMSNEDGERLSVLGWPKELEYRSDNPFFILFADPFSTPIEEVFSTIEHYCPGSQAIGGIASGGMDLGENRLVLNQDIYESGMVGVALWGPVSIRTVVSQGCQPIGERYVVTRAERNIIYELGGSRTLECLQQTIQSLVEQRGQQAAMALQVGIAVDEHRIHFERGDFLIRGLMGADRRSGGVAVSDVVQEGQTIQFHVRDMNAASEDLNLLLAQDRVAHPHEQPKGALLFSCNGRGRQFFMQPHHDVSTVRERTGDIPIAGFFAGGEIGPVAGKNYLHGYTASVALFCEATNF